ncbi:MAG: hypothetical protein ABIP78_09810 [Pyrinomonadaceae bacterium]
MVKVYLCNVFFLTLLSAVFCVGATAQKKPGKAPVQPDTVGTLIKKSGYEHQFIRKGVWTVDSDAGPILIGHEADVLVVFMIIAKKGELKLNAEGLSDILKLSDELNYLKFAIDEHGSLTARSESRLRLTDQAAFDDTLVRVLIGFEKAVAKLAPYLVK